MKSKEYLEDWSELLMRKGIGNKFSKRGDLWQIAISGWEDFNKLEEKGLKLYHSQKRNKWKRIMHGFKRNQISRNSYKDFYLKKMNELKKNVTAEELSKYLSKSKRVVNHYLSKLEKEKLIKRTNKGKGKPYLYAIST